MGDAGLERKFRWKERFASHRSWLLACSHEESDRSAMVELEEAKEEVQEPVEPAEEPVVKQETEVAKETEGDRNEHSWTVEERAALEEAEALKRKGNDAYIAKDHSAARELYTAAIEAAPEKAKEKSVYLANRAAVGLALEDYKSVVEDCTESLKINAEYTKALQRRAIAFEKLEEEEKALEDFQKVCELDGGNKQAQAQVRRLEPLVEQKREKLKEETLAKFKELGNMVLGKFGLSTDNFQTVKDPETGSYSVNFVQNS